MNQEESEHNEVDGMKKGVDSKGEVMSSVATKQACVEQIVPYLGMILLNFQQNV